MTALPKTGYCPSRARRTIGKCPLNKCPRIIAFIIQDVFKVETSRVEDIVQLSGVFRLRDAFTNGPFMELVVFFEMRQRLASFLYVMEI
jgi:hypothetical protein